MEFLDWMKRRNGLAEQEFLGTVLVLTSAASFGLMPIFIRLAYTGGVGVGELLLIRFLLGSIIMGSLLQVTKKFIYPTRREIIILLALGGIAYFLQSTFYYTALLYVPVSLLALILYTYPAFVAIGALTLGWERASKSVAASLLLAFLGLVLVTNFSGDVAALGILFAVGAAVTYSFYILFSSRTLRRLSGEGAIFYVMVGATVSFALGALASGDLRLGWDTRAWIWVLLIVLVSTCLAATTFFQGLKLIGATKTSILSVMEPITALAVAALVLSEPLNLQQLMGGALILAATIIAALSRGAVPE